MTSLTKIYKKSSTYKINLQGIIPVTGYHQTFITGTRFVKGERSEVPETKITDAPRLVIWWPNDALAKKYQLSLKGLVEAKVETKVQPLRLNGTKATPTKKPPVLTIVTPLNTTTAVIATEQNAESGSSDDGGESGEEPDHEDALKRLMAWAEYDPALDLEEELEEEEAEQEEQIDWVGDDALVFDVVNDFNNHPCSIADGVKGIYSGKHQSLSSFLAGVQSNASIKLSWVRDTYKKLEQDGVAVRPTDTIFKFEGKVNCINKYTNIGLYSDITVEFNPEWHVARNEEFTTVEALRALKNSGNANDAAEYGYQKKRLSGIALGKFNKSILPENYEPLSSSIIPLDFDKLTPAELTRLKSALCSLPEIVFCFTSISGVGLKAGLCVDSIKDDARYKQCFYYARDWLKSVDSGLILDESGKDIKRLIFTSYDSYVYLNSAAATLAIPEDFMSTLGDSNRVNTGKLNDTTLALMGINQTPYFPYSERRAAIVDEAVEVLKIKSWSAGLDEAGFKLLVYSFRSLVHIEGAKWPDDLARTQCKKHIEILCKGETGKKGYNEAEIDRMWDKNDFRPEGLSFASLLKEVPHRQPELNALATAEKYKNSADVPDIDLNNFAFSGFGSAEDGEDGEAFVADRNYKVFTTDVRDGTATTRALTELGNAYRIKDRFLGDVKFAIGHSFLHWVNGCWKWDLDGALTRRLAAELPMDIYAESIAQPLSIQQFANWSRASQTEAKIKNAVSLYSDFPEVRIPLNFIDGDAFKVGLANSTQVIDLKTGIVRPAERGDYVTKSLNVEEVGSAASAERWLRFLNEVFGNDQELIDWFKMWCGYLLTGSTKEQFFVFLYGFGSNGKGVLTTIINNILGDYSKTVGSETFTDTKRQAGAVSPDIAKLCGARLVLSTETNEGVALSEALVKTITGEDILSARFLNKEEFEFRPQFKVMMSGNHKPVIRGTDNGIWRRVRLLPFTRIFDDTEKDVNLSATLLAEAPHILAWLIEGCIEWQKEGLSKTPKVISDATAEYRAEQDILGLWLDEECETGAQHSQENASLYLNYKLWCEKNSNKPASNKTFSQRLSERGFDKRKSHGKMYWSGIKTAPLFFQEIQHK